MNKIYKIDKVLKYFYEISQIPRMSGKEEKIADYIEKFAQKKNLKYLMENENVALSRDKILNTVWNYDYYGDSRTIDSHIKKIRHKLGKKGKHIQTIRGIGYKFEVK